MVKVQGKSDYEKLDELLHDAVARFEWKLNITGWTRKTYDVYRPATPDERTIEVLARVESFATTNGEITIFHADAMPFAQELGARLEKEFGIEEAVIVERPHRT